MTATVDIFPAFRLESGVELRDVPVAWRSWGRLDDDGGNVIVVCHALTGNADVDDWWAGLLGPGRALDTDRYFVLCANVLGSPYGTASPLTINPSTGRPYARRVAWLRRNTWLPAGSAKMRCASSKARR